MKELVGPAFLGFIMIICIMGGCALMKDKGPELLKVVCPRCAAAIELLTGPGHNHEQPSRDGASND